jgi:hypothetical protein
MIVVGPDRLMTWSVVVIMVMKGLFSVCSLQLSSSETRVFSRERTLHYSWTWSISYNGQVQRDMDSGGLCSAAVDQSRPRSGAYFHKFKLPGSMERLFDPSAPYLLTWQG